MTVYCFDRDGTVDSSMGPVPLEWVRELAREQDVYAIGNQQLCQECEIPGVPHHPDTPDHVGESARVARLRYVQSEHPDETYVHIDDIDVGAGEWDGWTYYSPQGFVNAVESGEVSW